MHEVNNMSYGLFKLTTTSYVHANEQLLLYLHVVVGYL